AATNQVSAVSYFFIPPSAEKRNPVKIHHLVNALRNETWEIAPCAASSLSAGYHNSISRDRRSLTRGHTPAYSYYLPSPLKTSRPLESLQKTTSAVNCQELSTT